MKTFEDYKKEYELLNEMFVCSNRYLAMQEWSDEKQRELMLQEQEDIRELYDKYRKRLDKKCRKKTGRSVYEWRLDVQIAMFKGKANRPDASDEDVKKLLQACNYDVDLAVSLIQNEDISKELGGN